MYRFRHFYGVTGSIFGVYEALAKSTGRVPTLTNLAARHKLSRGAAMAWAIGLAVHFARHSVK